MKMQEYTAAGPANTYTAAIKNQHKTIVSTKTASLKNNLLAFYLIIQSCFDISMIDKNLFNIVLTIKII